VVRSRLAALSILAVAGLGLSACGGSDSGGTATAANRPQGRGPFAALTSDQRACLKKAGVNLPNFQRRQGPPPNGQQGVPPSGAPPAGAQRRFNPNSAQAKRMRAAFQKCGIQIPQPSQGQGPQTQVAPS